MSSELVRGPEWPEQCFALDLDALGSVTLADLAALERRTVPTVGVIRGRCEGVALAAAFAVDLLVAGPDATFSSPGDWTDVVIRRGREMIGRKAVGYLAMSSRAIPAGLAHRLGLVTYLDDEPEAEATKLVEQVSARSRVAVAAILKQAHRGAAADYAMAEITRGSLDLPLTLKVK